MLLMSAACHADNTHTHERIPEVHTPAAYAYILTHPGVPAVLWEHVSGSRSSVLREAVGQLIAVRQRNGIHACSKLEILAAESDLYVARINDRYEQRKHHHTLYSIQSFGDSDNIPQEQVRYKSVESVRSLN